ncbi:MAG TPA: nuclear transport factor 2 family protein [Pseudomonadales bacterium]
MPHRTASIGLGWITAAWLLLAAGCAGTGDAARTAEPAAGLEAEVLAAERAFAATMADRDHAAFTRFLAEEAVFFGDGEVLRGRDAVAAGWRPLFDGAEPPFSWDPDTVEVLASGTLALTSGPVFDPNGAEVARFHTVWRREADGAWRVVFDKGTPACPPAR